MRPIDADALMEGYKQMGYDPTEHPEESYMEGWCKGFNAAVDHCIHHVIHAPIIEPQRMRGKWIDQKGGGCCCSECGRYALDEPDGNFIHVAVKSNFCPNCGCQMNGDEEDEQ